MKRFSNSALILSPLAKFIGCSENRSGAEILNSISQISTSPVQILPKFTSEIAFKVFVKDVASKWTVIPRCTNTEIHVSELLSKTELLHCDININGRQVSKDCYSWQTWCEKRWVGGGILLWVPHTDGTDSAEPEHGSPGSCAFPTAPSGWWVNAY